MAKKVDDALLLVLSEKEASILRDIIETPAELIGRDRVVRILLLILLFVTAFLVGLVNHELIRDLASSVMLLIL